MANPLPEEGKLYESIKKRGYKIPDDVWRLIEHHIGNDLHVINFLVESYVMGDSPEPVPVKDAKRILEQTQEVKKFLMKLRDAARPLVER